MPSTDAHRFTQMKMKDVDFMMDIPKNQYHYTSANICVYLRTKLQTT
jgi:hypothetical protein